MKVCILGDAASVHLQRIVPGLVERGVDVHVVCHHPVALRGASVEKFRVPPAGLSNPRRWRNRWKHYLISFLRRFDIVHVHFLHDWGFSPAIMEHGCLVATPWGSDIIPPPGEAPPSPELLERRVMLLRHAAGLTAWGPTFARSVAEFAKVDRGRIELLPLGVDLDLFRPAVAYHRGSSRDSSPTHSPRGLTPAAQVEPRPSPAATGGGRYAEVQPSSGDTLHVGTGRVGFFKGFREVYGATYLVRAVPLVLDVFPSARFDLVGDGPQLDKCRALAERLGVSSALNWLPRRPHSRMPELIRRWDVTVNPSLCESFGAAALESSAMQVPVVASDVGGLPDTVRDGQTGLLVPPENPQALGAAIIRLLRDTPLRERMGKAGRKMVTQEYDWAAILDKWVRTYRAARDRVAVMV